MGRPISRRALLVGAGGLAALAVGGAVAGEEVAGRVQRALLDEGPAGIVPDVPEGVVRAERRTSSARGRDVGFWTAVPHGSGDGDGLPVCLVLHGASATTADYDRFGFARFLTAAVRDGVPPFVLAGADGGRTRWDGDGAGSADDPQRMLAEELPAWCAERGYDASRLAAYGWSMGGYGALRAAELRPATLRAVAALSPAVSSGDPVLDDAGDLDPARTGLWCGRSDGFLPAVQELAEEVRPAVAAWALGGHTRRYWDRVTPDALAFVGHLLAA